MIEPVFYWPDRLNALHRQSVEAQVLRRIEDFPDNPAAREEVLRLREEVVSTLNAFGAVHLQIGRLYPFARDLEPTPHDILRRIKRELDPENRINPRGARPVTTPSAKTPAIRRASARVRVDGCEIDLHYRVAGDGPPLFALHPSPLDSAFLAPLMARLATHATVIAPDTPGFGFSDPVPGPIRDLAPCVRAMSALRAALGLAQVGVYGSATGAQIAVEWAKSEPEALSGVMLDNAAAFDDAGPRPHHAGLPARRDTERGRRPPGPRMAGKPRCDAVLPLAVAVRGEPHRARTRPRPGDARHRRRLSACGAGLWRGLSRRLPQRARGTSDARLDTARHSALARQHPRTVDPAPRRARMGAERDHGPLRPNP